MQGYSVASVVFVALVISCCCPGAGYAQPATDPKATSSRPPVNDASAASVGVGQSGENPAELDADLKVKKLKAEIAKLQAEVDSLKAVGPTTRKFTTVMGAIGGFAGAIIGIFAVVIGSMLNRNFKHTQKTKLEQDEELSREQHNIELFQSLGHGNLRVQLAAAAMLIQRLHSLNDDEPGEIERRKKRAIEAEKNTIVQGLVAVTKEHSENTHIEAPDGQTQTEHPPTHPALLKFIADNLVKVMGAVVEEGKMPPEDKPSPIKEYDFQKARLMDVYWWRVDARGKDFYQADFRDASLKQAFLQDAVFYDADLRQAKLYGADLRGANLFGTKLEGAEYDQDTKWPTGFDPTRAGAVCKASKAADG
jgi:hypothetical protein